MFEKFWKVFFLQPRSVTHLPVWLRVSTMIAATVVLCSLLVCLTIISILLVRLGCDALFSSGVNYQEIVRNFLLAFASAFGAPFLVWRAWVAHQQANAAAEQARVALENHVTGILFKAVELSGLVREMKSSRPDGTPVAQSAPNVEARLGALYLLERLLLESQRDQRAILETLCAYVRENSPLEVSKDEADAPISPLPTRRGDVQAALTIIGRRPESVRTRAESERWRLDLKNSNLIGYDFSNLNFNRADFNNSFLNAANMTRGLFLHCVFAHTIMSATEMNDASFDSSVFDNCNVERAQIENTSFRLAKFVDTDLRKANVTSFGIEGANFEHAFGGFLKYAVENVIKEGPSSYNVTEIVSIDSLFKKATFDKDTNVAQEVHDAIELMNPNTQRSTGQA
jgi:hypothetical protein